MNTKPRPAPPGGASAVAHTLTGNDAATLTLKVAEHRRARRKHARNSPTPPRPRRPSPGNPGSPYSRPASHSPQHTAAPGKGGTAPSPRGRGPWNRAPSPPRHAGVSYARASSGNRLQDTHGTLDRQHPTKPKTPKVRGVGAEPRPGQLAAGRKSAQNHAF